MRMTKKHLARLTAGMVRSAELSPSIRETYRNAGYSDERFRWDAFHGLRGLDGYEGLARELYRCGLNDDHIDTALRRAVDDAWPMARGDA